MTAQILNLDGMEAVQIPPSADAIDPKLLALTELIDAMGLADRQDAIAEALPYDSSTLALVDVLNVMARLGFPADCLALKLCDIDRRLLPCLFVDDAGGRLCTITEPTDEKTTGTAYFFHKEEVHDGRQEAEEREATGRGWSFVTLMRFRKLIMNVVIISLALNVVSLGLPIFLMVIYDRVVDITAPDTIYALGVGAILLLSIEWTLRRLRSRGLSWLAARFDHLVGNQVLSRLLQLPASAIERASVAAQVSRIRNFESFREFFTGPLFLTLLDIPFTLVALALLAAIAGSVVFIPLAAALIYCVFLLVFHPWLRLAMFRAAQARSNAQSHQIELIEKIQALRLNGMSEVWFDQFRDISALGSTAMFRSQYLSNALDTLVHAVALLAGLGVIYAGVTGVWSGAITGGAVFASLLLVWRILGPLQTLCGNIPRLLQIRRTFQQIDRLMDLSTERELAPGLAKLSSVKGRIRFSKVGLRYNKDSDPVFAGLSFAAEPGELIAIAGGNGSGKSTVLKLALGMYRPQAGAIYLDESDIRQIDPAELRKRLAYVPQIPELFEGTVAENIRLANPAASEAQLLRALRFAGVEEEVRGLAQGLETPLRGNGRRIQPRLSFGISMARAFVKDAPVLLIDELSYAILNSDAGTVFMESVKRWRGEKTILMVSHRDDHIRMGDRAIGLLEGDRALVGTPDRVIDALRAEDDVNYRRPA